MSRPFACRCCGTPAYNVYCAYCAVEQDRRTRQVARIIGSLWGSDGVERFEAAARAERLQASRRRRGAAA